jgi:hypothetical protein
VQLVHLWAQQWELQLVRQWVQQWEPQSANPSVQ